MWRNDDLYVALWMSAHPQIPEPPDPFAAAREGSARRRCYPPRPLMHGTGLFATLGALAGGGTVVLVDRQGLDAELVWDTVARERVAVLTIVGDVFARPLLDALRRHPDRWDLIVAARDHLVGRAVQPRGETRPARPPSPRVTIVDSLGASEGLGPRNVGARRRRDHRAGAVLGERPHPRGRRGHRPRRRSRERRGRAGRDGRPDPARLLQGPREERRARSACSTACATPSPVTTPRSTTDGTVRLLGRGSACINTGGEKVYPEEVEAELRKPPGRVRLRRGGRAPTSASASRWWRWCRSTDGRRPRRGRAGWRGAVTGWPGTRRRAASCSSTRSSARPRARRTTRAARAGRSGCSPSRHPAERRDAGGAQAPRASGADQLSTGGGAISSPRPGARHPVATGALGLVERGVGRGHQSLGVGGVVGHGGDAAADGHRRLPHLAGDARCARAAATPIASSRLQPGRSTTNSSPP